MALYQGVCFEMFAVFSYCEEACVISLSSSDSFESIVRRICLRWSTLKANMLNFSYSLPEFPHCLLTNDEDLKTMIGISASLGMKRLRVDVVDKGCSNVVDKASSVNATVLDSWVLSDESDDEIDLLSTFCHPQDKVVLSLGWEKCIIGVGQKFDGGASEFRLALKKFTIDSGYAFSYIKNDSKRVIVVCKTKKESGCSWMVHASKEPANGFFYIRKMQKIHSCGSYSRNLSNVRMGSNLVAELIRDDVRCNPSTRPILVKKRLLTNYGFKVSYDNAWSGVDKAKCSLYGSAKESFRGLSSYVKSIFDTNPGSYVFLEVYEGTNRFRRLFVAFHASIQGFNYIRPMLFLDGAHIKSQFKGNILSAIGKDGNQGIFPLCFGFVDAEDNDNWFWFLTHLREILDPGRRITFISDRNSGLVDGIPMVFPNCFHYFCLYHLKLNMRDKCSRHRKFKFFKKRMVHLLRACAFAPTVELFNLKMAELLIEGGDVAKDFFKSLPVENWANAQFKGMKYGEMASSAVESFNNWILEERHLPICNMLDAIRIKLMKLLADRKSKAACWNSELCPKIDKFIGQSINACRTWEIVNASPDLFEVFSFPSCTVDLKNFSCSCKRWQLYGFPCPHATVCILRSKRQLCEFVDPGYLSRNYAASYNIGLYPIANIYQIGSTSSSNSPCVLPPLAKRPAGRPRKLRIASKGEGKKRLMRCGRCRLVGSHNKKTCKAPVLFN